MSSNRRQFGKMMNKIFYKSNDKIKYYNRNRFKGNRIPFFLGRQLPFILSIFALSYSLCILQMPYLFGKSGISILPPVFLRSHLVYLPELSGEIITVIEAASKGYLGNIQVCILKKLAGMLYSQGKDIVTRCGLVGIPENSGEMAHR